MIFDTSDPTSFDPFCQPLPAECLLSEVEKSNHFESNHLISHHPKNDNVLEMFQYVLRTTGHPTLEPFIEWTRPVPPINVSSILGSDALNNIKIPTKDVTQKGVVITAELLTLPQISAAKKLGIATSSLSKKWKAATNGRKWPFRTIVKLDKEIMVLLNNISPQKPIDPIIEYNLAMLFRRRQQEQTPVHLR